MCIDGYFGGQEMNISDIRYRFGVTVYDPETIPICKASGKPIVVKYNIEKSNYIEGYDFIAKYDGIDVGNLLSKEHKAHCEGCKYLVEFRSGIQCFWDKTVLDEVNFNCPRIIE